MLALYMEDQVGKHVRKRHYLRVKGVCTVRAVVRAELLDLSSCPHPQPAQK